MKINKEKEVKRERILARIMSKEISREQLEQAAGAGIEAAGTCTTAIDGDGD